MPDYSTFFISLMSISVVLLSICTALRNAAFAALLRPESSGVSIGNRDYEAILKTSGKRALVAGIIFAGNTLLAFIGYMVAAFSSSTAAVFGMFVFVALVFLVGGAQLVRSLTGGHIQVLAPQPDREETEPQNKDTENSAPENETVLTESTDDRE